MPAKASLNADFHSALRSGSVDEAAALLAAHRALLENNLTETNSLVIAVSAGQKEMAKWLRDHGATVDLSDVIALNDIGVFQGIQSAPYDMETGCSAADYISILAKYENGYLEWIERLSMLGANGEDGLRVASSLNSPSAARLLLEQGLNPNCRDSEGQTPLHLCAAPDDRFLYLDDFVGDETANVLINANADVDSRDESGQTPLHLAASGDNVPVALALLKAGANSKALNSCGLTPEQVARNAGNAKLAALIVSWSEC